MRLLPVFATVHGPGRAPQETAKSPGWDGTASYRLSRAPSGQEGRLWTGLRVLQGETC